MAARSSKPRSLACQCHEGKEIAEWFNSIGVTGIVLKYRVPRRDKELPHRAPLQDAQRAIRLVRQVDYWNMGVEMDQNEVVLDEIDKELVKFD